MEYLRFIVVCLLGSTAILSIVGIVVLKISGVEPDASLAVTVGACLVALTHVLSQPVANPGGERLGTSDGKQDQQPT